MKKASLSLGMILSASMLTGCELGYSPEVMKLWGSRASTQDTPTPAVNQVKTNTVPTDTTRHDLPPPSEPSGDLPPPLRPSEEGRGKGRKGHKEEHKEERKEERKFEGVPGSAHQRRPRREDDGDRLPHREQQPEERPLSDDDNQVRGASVSEGCSSRDPESICLGIKYVSYRDSQGAEVETEQEAIQDVQEANLIWRECGIQFQIDDYKSVLPDEFDLRFRTDTYSEFNEIRRSFQNSSELLVVATGRWDRSGMLGDTYANAWTHLP
jgi:hypothetical protein